MLYGAGAAGGRARRALHPALVQDQRRRVPARHPGRPALAHRRLHVPERCLPRRAASSARAGAARRCWRARATPRRPPTATIRGFGSGRSARRISTFTRTRARKRWRGGSRRSPNASATKLEPVLGRAARPRAGDPRRPDRSRRTAGRRRSPTTRSRSRRCRRRRRRSSATRPTGSSWSSRTNTRTSSTSIASRGFMQGVRRVFGRVPVAFPERVPAGLAGRRPRDVRGEPDDRPGAHSRRRLPRDRGRRRGGAAASSRSIAPAAGSTDWPGGHAPYAYGAYFHQFLADRYGPERLARLADATSGRVPFFGGGAFKNVFGRSAGGSVEGLPRRARDGRRPRPDDTTRGTRLTRHGFTVTAPRVAADGDDLLRASSNPHGFPALMRLPPGGQPARVAWRALREPHVGPRRLDRVRSARARALGRAATPISTRSAAPTAGRVRRLTRDARAGDPDLSPDGRQIVCTVQATGRRALALIDFPPPAVDGRRGPRRRRGGRTSPGRAGRRTAGTIVAARRYARRGYELVLVDPATGAIATLAVARTRRAPGHAVLDARRRPASSSPPLSATRPFNVFAVDVATRRRPPDHRHARRRAVSGAARRTAR